MADETGSPVTGYDTSVELPADAPEAFNSVREAAEYYASLKEKKPENKPAESANEATAENELSVEDSADPETDPGETEEVEAVDPPIERPKSWSKDEDAEWQSLPRAMQQKIVARELERDNGTTRSQQEAANARKVAETQSAKLVEMERALAAKLPEIDTAIQRFLSNQYPDINTPADVKKMALEDPFRKIQWDTDQQEIAWARAEAAAAATKVETAKQNELIAYRQQQTAKFAEFAPEMKDPIKNTEITNRAVKALTDEIGISRSELEEYAANPIAAKLLFHAGFQRLLYDHLKLGEIKSAPARVAPKVLPPVQRPGTSKPSGSVSSEREQILNRKSELTVKEATELYELQTQRTSRRRAS